MSIHWIALNSVHGLGPVRIKKLLEIYQSPEEVFNASDSELQQYIPETCSRQMRSDQLFEKAEKQQELAKNLGIDIITMKDPSYPRALKEIYAPPPILYVKGNLSCFNSPSVGVVGTRYPTSYGKTSTTAIVNELLQYDFVIASGLARGIDTVAHSATVQNNKPTIAVLGSGLDKIYPPENKELATKITERGALVSEFPLGTPPESFNFPRRNRIISGLSFGIVVMEAGERSGALITAEYALQQGRDIFALPGPINSAQSMGTFKLIKEGAIPIRSGHDIASVINKSLYVPKTSSEVVKKNSISDESLSEKDSLVLSLLQENPLRLDQIVDSLKLEFGEILSLLLNLELRGIVRQLPGQQYIRN